MQLNKVSRIGKIAIDGFIGTGDSERAQVRIPIEIDLGSGEDVEERIGSDGAMVLDTFEESEARPARSGELKMHNIVPTLVYDIGESVEFVGAPHGMQKIIGKGASLALSMSVDALLDKDQLWGLAKCAKSTVTISTSPIPDAQRSLFASDDDETDL